MRFLTGFLLGVLLRPLILLAAAAGGALLIYGATKNGIDDVASALTTKPATIIRAVDGDTLLVRTGGRQERVRVLGIDTPETVKPGASVQACGPEASARAKSWSAAHRTVKLVSDSAAPDRDRYRRVLRYVQPASGGRDLSTVQVAAGLARVKAYGQDLDKLPALQAAQRRAKAAHRGLWGGACSR